jgi:mycothiol synthase
MPTPPEFTLRPYAPRDAPTVVELINAAASRTMGVRRATIDGAGNLRLSRYVPSGSEKVVAVNAQNIPIGYAYLAPSEQYVLYELGGAVHPSDWGRGVGTRLVEWAGQRAAELAGRAPQGVKAVLQTNVFAAEQQAIRLLERQGFAQVREWVHMVIDLDAAPQPPLLLGTCSIRLMDLDNDWERVGPVLDAAFADHWGAIALPPGSTQADPGDQDAASQEATPVDSSYSNAPGVCFIALDGETVVGGILCNAKLVERDDTGRIGSLFVLPAYRRQGVGRALMLAAFQAFWQRGIGRVILDTDAHSFTAAPRFYAHLGMRPYRQEWLYEKEVRPGKEVRRL